MLPSFTGLCLVLLGFCQVFPLAEVLLQWVLPSFTGFYLVFWGFCYVFAWAEVRCSFPLVEKLDFTLILLGFTWFCLIWPSWRVFFQPRPSRHNLHFYWLFHRNRVELAFLWVAQLCKVLPGQQFNSLAAYSISMAIIFHRIRAGATDYLIRCKKRYLNSSSCIPGLMNFTGFYLVLPGFTGFYQVLPSFTQFYLVLLSFTQFYRVLPSFTRFYLV